MFRQFVMASASAIALAGSALAADLSSPSFSWTGVYAGGQIGYAAGVNNTTIGDGGFANGFTPPTTTTTTATTTTTTVAGGGAGGSGGSSGGTLAQSIGGSGGSGGFQVSTGGGASGGTTGVGSVGGITTGSGSGIVGQSLGGGTGGGATAGSITAAAISPASASAISTAAAATAADPTKPFIPYNFSDFSRFNNNANGVIGGAHVGYNYQINQFVLGLEGDVDGSSLSKTANFAPFSSYYQDFIPTTVHSNLGVQGSIRGRLGYAFDRVLVYATGGVAFGGFNTTVSTAYANALFYPAFFGSDSFSNTRVGWTVGGGLEYAITNNWSVRAEYRYTDFGPSNNVLANSFPGFNGDFLGATVHTNLIENRVQVGFSYKFDTAAPAPVVAKY